MPSTKPPADRPALGQSQAESGRSDAQGTATAGHPRREPRAWTRRSRSAEQTERIGRLIGRSLCGGEVLALCGELGAGKTTLVRGIVAGLGASPGLVSSPTVVLIHHYSGRLPLVHADLYRIESPEQMEDLGLADYLDGRTVVAVEWAEKAGAELPTDRVEVRLSHLGRSSRVISVRPLGPGSTSFLARLKHLDRSRRRTVKTRQAGRSLAEGAHPVRPA